MAEDQAWKPAYNPWLIAVVVAIAAFMEILDTSIANVALPHISGNLGATQDQGTWVLTTYLVANAIVLPTTGWLTSVIGRKRLFLICIAIFTASSVLCGMANTMPILLFARVLQGAGGGGLQPMSQAIMADSFPQRMRGMAFSLYGLTVVLAPALGPTLGGWITDHYTWRWIFLMNVPIGLIAMVMVIRVVEDPPFLRRFKINEVRFDYIGFSLLVLGVSALQIFLDKGQEDDWLGSSFITTLIVLCIVCLTALVIWEWRQKQPLVDVKLFKIVSFSSATLIIFFAGAVAFSSTVLMPQFLQTLMGYSAQQAGLIVSIGAGILIIIMPIVGALTSKFPAKYLIAIGWLASAAGLFLTTKLLSLNISFGTAGEIMLMQYAPLGLIFVPAITVSYVGVSADRSDAVSGLSNFGRNIGSSVGASIVQTILARRQQFHLVRLGEHFTPSSLALHRSLTPLTLYAHHAGANPVQAKSVAFGSLYRSMMAQAASLSYLDGYIFLAAGGAVMFLLSFLLKSNDPKHTETHIGH